jgi:pyrroline-5-carboxylate reductase
MTAVAIIGGGKLGEALLSGLIAAGREPGSLSISETDAARARALGERFGIRAGSIPEVAERAEVIVIAVKPADVDPVLRELAVPLRDSAVDHLVASFAAGVPIAHYEAGLPAGTPVVRLMSNTPIRARQAMTAAAPGRLAREEHLTLVSELLEPLGELVVVSESNLNAVTAVAGSGPAYVYLLAEAMIDAAVSVGLEHRMAKTMVRQTIIGAAALLSEDSAVPQDLRSEVTSPGGTTAAALVELERKGLRAAVIDAVHAAAARSAELGRPKSPAS